MDLRTFVINDFHNNWPSVEPIWELKTDKHAHISIAKDFSNSKDLRTLSSERRARGGERERTEGLVAAHSSSSGN